MPEQDEEVAPISKAELLNAVRLIVRQLKQKNEVTTEELKEILSEKEQGQQIPLELFQNEKLSSLEITCKYLHENQKLNYRQVGQLLNRNERTIWSTCKNANKKLPSEFLINSQFPSYPAKILFSRKYSVLEAIVLHLIQTYTVKEISRMLRKPYSTIWATLSKAKRKQNA